MVFGCILLATALPVSAQSPAPPDVPTAWLIDSPSFGLLSGGAETALLSQLGLLDPVEVLPAEGEPGPGESLAPPTGGTDVLVNRPGEGEAAPNCNTQNEVTLARSGETVVAGWVDGGQCDKLVQRTVPSPTTGISLSGFGYSSEGGRPNTWTDGGVLAPPEGGNLFGDPVLAAGPDGTFYYATLVGTPSCCTIGVARSTDGGQTWPTLVDLNPNRDPSTLQDKPWIAVDGSANSPHQGAVYAAWTEFAPPPPDCIPPDPCRAEVSVLFSRSIDDGDTFENPMNLSQPVNVRGGIGTQVAVGPDGEVYVAWLDAFTLQRLWFVRSLDGGATFTAAQRAALVIPIGHPQADCFPRTINIDPNLRFVLNGDIRVNSLPSLTVDVSGSSDPQSPLYNPYRGRVYVAVPHDEDGASILRPPGDESDVAFFYSTDRGATWENLTPDTDVNVMLNDDEPHTEVTGTDQFHPQVAVDSEGRVAVSWYDRRVSRPTLQNWDMTVFATVSTDGGETFGPNIQVGDDPFPPSRTNPNTNWLAGCYMGEYNGMTGGVGEFLLAWGDNRDGPDEFPDPNVYFDRITLHDPLATDDSATTVNGIPVTIDVLRNDSDPNGDPLTVTEVTQPAHGTAEINANQTVTYDPVCGFQGIDTFNYTINDGRGGTDTGLVSVRARRTTRRTTGC